MTNKVIILINKETETQILNNLTKVSESQKPNLEFKHQSYCFFQYKVAPLYP